MKKQKVFLYNSLSRRKEEFQPIDEKNVKMYVCGPTVYDRAHLGNARSSVIYDVLYRALKQVFQRSGGDVTYVRNITDVDDKIIAAAKENKEKISDLTKRMIEFYHADMKALNVALPDIEPKATENIEQMIKMISSLIEKGFAYENAGHVLFDTTKYKDYGALAGRSKDEMIAGARVEVAPYKKSAGDFVLWKPAGAEDDNSAKFNSPWGVGRPGWHIECSAMSTRYLGNDFDIHGGGADLMFPHHENEVAQSKCAHQGSVYAKYWVHNGFLTVNGEKMSKSLGNFITVKDLLDKGVKGEVIRYALLSSHYRKPLDWTEKLLDDAKKSLNYFYQIIAEIGLEKLESYKHNDDDYPATDLFVSELADELNTPKCMEMLFSLAKTAISNKDEEMKLSYAKSMLECGRIMGFFTENPESWFKNVSEDASIAIQKLVDQRITAKKSKDFAAADGIRKQLTEMGVVLEDKADGSTIWKKI